MQEQLKNIEELLRKIEPPSNQQRSEFNMSLIDLKQNILKVIAIKYSKKEKKGFISFCTFHLITIINNLAQINNPNDNPDNIPLILELEQCLLFLQKKAAGWFDYTYNTPLIMVEKLKKEIPQCEYDIKINLKQNGISRKLIDISLRPIFKFSLKDKNISLNKYFYIKKYINWLKTFSLEEYSQDEPDCIFMKYLITKNLNSNSFYNSLINFINKKIQKYNTYEQKLEYLSHLKICLNDIIPEKDIIYNPGKPSVQASIIEAIDIRMNHYIRIKSFYNTQEQLPAQVNEQSNSPYKHENHKITTSLSVAELAAFSRLLVEENFLEDVSIKQIAHLLTNTIKGVNVSDISPKSLRNNYYSLDENALESLKLRMKSVSKKIDEYIYILKYK